MFRPFHRLPRQRSWLLPALIAVLAACGSDNDPIGPVQPTVGAPENLALDYEWILDGWDGSGNAVGQPSVVVTWELPSAWNGEAFRVYGRQSNQQAYALLATVTSCASGVCRYTDLNVAPGEEYDYYVAAVDQRTGREVPTEVARPIEVPVYTPPAVPDTIRAIALDNAVYLQWDAEEDAARYRVLGRPEGEIGYFDIGETDGSAFLDTRVANGVQYTYRIAAVDEFGHVSDFSPVTTVTPRPDYHAELLYAVGDSLVVSGFRFVSSDEDSPIVAGDSPEAQWRLEYREAADEWVIQPLGETQVTQKGVFSTALTCGPDSDAGCTSVDVAPSTGYGRTGVVVNPEETYVFRIPAEGGGFRYGKVRVSALGRSTGEDYPLLLFDWAYQLRTGDPNLSQRPG